MAIIGVSEAVVLTVFLLSLRSRFILGWRFVVSMYLLIALTSVGIGVGVGDGGIGDARDTGMNTTGVSVVETAFQTRPLLILSSLC